MGSIRVGREPAVPAGGAAGVAAFMVTAFLTTVALLLPLASPPAAAAPFNCTFRTSCAASETEVFRAENDSGGYNNAHVQVLNDTSMPYAYALCCGTDANHTLDADCAYANAVPILLAYAMNNSHVQIPGLATYPYGICLGVDYGNFSCQYVNGTCGAGYSAVLSMASSEGSNATNAHVGNYSHYLVSVCCQIGNGAPYMTELRINSSSEKNTSAENLSAHPVGLTDPDNDAIGIVYNWRRNGTSIAVLNMNFDVNNSAGASKTRDYSTYGNDGTLGNGTAGTEPTWNATGGWNGTGAYTFDGSNDFITITDTDFYDNTDISIEVWVNPSSITGRKNIITSGTSGGDPYYHILIDGSDIRIYAGASYSTITAGLQAGVWQHLVFTFGIGTTNAGTVYLDGSQIGTFNRGTGSGTGVAIGKDEPSYTYTGWYQGSIDGIGIYNRELSQQEIQNLANGRPDLLAAEETVAGEKWNVCATPNDGQLDGDTYCSVNLTILRSVPTVPVQSSPANGNGSVFERNVTLDWLPSTDGDGDTITYDLNLTVAPGSCAIEHLENGVAQDSFLTDELCTDQQYNWTLRACDTDGCSTWTPSWNFTIASVLGIRFLQNTTDFGTLDIDDMVSTDTGTGSPLVVENDGNIIEDISFRALTALFNNATLNTTNFRYRVAENETGAFLIGSSQTAYRNVSNVYTAAFDNLSYVDAADDGLIHLNVTVPSNEPPGTKSTTVMVRATAS